MNIDCVCLNLSATTFTDHIKICKCTKSYLHATASWHDDSVCSCTLSHWITWLNSRHLNSLTNFFFFRFTHSLVYFWLIKVAFLFLIRVFCLLFFSQFKYFAVSQFCFFFVCLKSFWDFQELSQTIWISSFLFVVKLRSKSIHWIKRFEKKHSFSLSLLNSVCRLKLTRNVIPDGRPKCVRLAQESKENWRNRDSVTSVKVQRNAHCCDWGENNLNGAHASTFRNVHRLTAFSECDSSMHTNCPEQKSHLFCHRRWCSRRRRCCCYWCMSFVLRHNFIS